jgi:virulence factor
MNILEIYKRQRKYAQMRAPYGKQYAFVGVGNHSLNNLYPALDYLHVPLKYIVSNSKQTANRMKASAWNCAATNDFDLALDDPEIGGVFISAHPGSHYHLVKKALAKRKHVFVEKPPCQTLSELQDLIALQEDARRYVLVGLQKRYAPATVLLKKALQDVGHYTLHYRAGAFPEQNPVLDLFIHPVDLVAYLFGKGEIKSLLRNADTLFVQLQHHKRVIGAIELSTGYSWQQAEEQLTVVEKNDIYRLNGLSELLRIKKPQTLLSYPLEKVARFVPETKTLFNQNTFLPDFRHNTLYINGFYSEINTFVHACETNNFKANLSGLTSLTATYEILQQLSSK